MLLSNPRTVGARRSNASRSYCPCYTTSCIHVLSSARPYTRSSGRELGTRHLVRVLEEPQIKKSSAEAFIEEIQQSMKDSDTAEQEQSVVAANISDLQQQVANIEQQVSAYVASSTAVMQRQLHGDCRGVNALVALLAAATCCMHGSAAPVPCLPHTG